MFDVIKLVVSFALGLAVATTIFVLYQFATGPLTTGGLEVIRLGLSAFLVTMITAAALGLPILLGACLALVLFRKTIGRHFGALCAIALPIVAAAYAGIDYLALNKSNMPFTEYVMLEPVIIRVAFALGTSALTAVIFYFWSSVGDETGSHD